MQNMEHGNNKSRLLVSHMMLRRIVGVLGISLPFVLMIWGFALAGWSLELQESISAYYYLDGPGDFFVGTLFFIAWFFFAYRVYDRKDDIAGFIACVLALGVVFFPCNGREWEEIIHSVSAAGLFLTLSYFSLCLFTKTGKEGSPTPQKRMRNKVYIACGLVMLTCMVLIGIYSLFFQDNTAISDLKPVFWLETIIIWAFGISWFVKGETLLRDKKA